MRIEDAATEYTEGKVTFILKPDEFRKEELEFNLDITVSDKTTLMRVEKEINDKNEKDRTLTDQIKVIKDIIKRSYPSQTDKWVDSIVTKYGHELLLEIYFMWKWRDRDMFNRISEIKKKKMDELLEQMFQNQVQNQNLNPTLQSSKD